MDMFPKQWSKTFPQMQRFYVSKLFRHLLRPAGTIVKFGACMGHRNCIVG